MGAYIAGHFDAPRRVLCSTALRARQTWELAAPALPADIPVDYSGAIYDADARELIAVLRALPDDAEPVLLIGHNPALEACAARLAGGGDTRGLQTMASKYPTAALAMIVFDVAHWWDIAPGAGRLDRFVRPKDLG